MLELPQEKDKAKEGTFLYREDVFHASRSGVQRSSIFVVDLSEEAALEKTSYSKTTISHSQSTSSLPVYENLVPFFIQDAPPIYQVATGKELESTELKAVPIDEIVACTNTHAHVRVPLTRCEIILRFLVLLMFIAIVFSIIMSSS